jgi:beta-glucosidase
MQKFLDDLLSRMTLEEKFGQLNLLAVGFDITGPILNNQVDEKIRAGRVGAIIGAYTVSAVRPLQEFAVRQSRLGIPLLFACDVVHGQRTIFPIPLGLSASWNPELVRRTARAAADEATAEGLNWTYSPMVDISREPRWGRVMEGAGEDPHLGALIAAAMVSGYQQDDLSKPDSLLACVKHFALYGAPEGGRDYNTVDMSRLRMFNEYLAPYAAAVSAGAGSVMTAFNEVEGVPATANRWLLCDLLRQRWGFDGFVVTDYGTLPEIITHGAAADRDAATVSALAAGTDMDMASEFFITDGARLVKEGRLAAADVDAACRRVLTAKYQLGLFQNPFKNLDRDTAPLRVMTPDKLQLAKEAAVKSMVLLRNERRTLPLSAGQKILFTGPLVARQRDLIGAWSAGGDWQRAVSLRAALEQRFDATGSGMTFAQGCNLIDDPAYFAKLEKSCLLEKSAQSPAALRAEAARAAADADVVVAVLGEAFKMSGEACCRADIGLPPQQRELLKALKLTGKPLVLVLMNGRPLTLEWEAANVDAILEAWFPGTQGGPALVDVLFGDAAPTGKLTMSFPRHVGQIPVYYNHKNGNRPYQENGWFTSRYQDVPNDPLFPFGHGLTYTDFTLGAPTLDKTAIVSGSGDALTVSVPVTNIGPRDGTETVQLYIRDMAASVTRPVKELKDFRQVFVRAGETLTVAFTISEEMLKFYNADLRYLAEPGEFQVLTGSDSARLQSATFRLVG